MKKFFYSFFFELGKLLSWLRVFRIFRTAVLSCYYRFYSGTKSGQFATFGDNVLLAPYNTLVGAKFINIEDDVRIGKGITLTAWAVHDTNQKPKIIIKKRARIGENAHITCINSIEIGSDVLTGRNLLITDNAHGNKEDAVSNIPPIERSLISKGGVVIEDGVWLADNVSVLPGVRIGSNSIIGANVVVSKDVPPYTVVVGATSRYIDMK